MTDSEREFWENRARAAGEHPKKCDCPACNGGELLASYEAAVERLKAMVRDGNKADAT